MKYVYISILSFISLSCSQNRTTEKEYFKEFPFIIYLEHEKIETNSTIYAVGGMILMDSVLLTVDIKTDTFFQVYKLPVFNPIGGYINRGRGPNEEIIIDPFISHISNNSFLYRGMSSVKIMHFNAQTNSMDKSFVIELPDDLLDLWHIFKLGDSIIGTNLHNEAKKEFTGLNIRTKEIFEFGHTFPDIGRQIDDSYKSVIFAKATTVKPDETEFASVYDKFPILRIYSIDGKLKKEISYDNHQSFPHALIQKSPSKHDINEIMQNYRKIKSTNQYIYALYIGKRNKELSEGLNDFSNEIHVWDWDGHPIVKIILDQTIFSFDVDDQDNYFICSSLEQMDYFYKYHLNFNQ